MTPSVYLSEDTGRGKGHLQIYISFEPISHFQSSCTVNQFWDPRLAVPDSHENTQSHTSSAATAVSVSEVLEQGPPLLYIRRTSGRLLQMQHRKLHSARDPCWHLATKLHGSWHPGWPVTSSNSTRLFTASGTRRQDVSSPAHVSHSLQLGPRCASLPYHPLQS